jgi:hypothetical protein
MVNPVHDSPFDLNNEEAYRRWREQKLKDYPHSTTELVVSIADPLQLTTEERDALLAVIRKTNMAI